MHRMLPAVVVPSPSRPRPAPVARAPLVVSAHRSLAALAPLSAEVAALSARSGRACPFATPAFLRRAVEEDEFLDFDRDATPLLLLAYEAGALKAFLPLRERVVPGAFGGPRVEPLLTHDVERPHVVAAPEDEDRAARAFVEHLCAERRAPFIDLVGVEPDGALARACADFAARARPGGKRLFRTVDGPPLSVIPTGSYATIDAYWSALAKKMRSNTGRLVRRLASAGELTWIESDARPGLDGLFDLYLSVEARSWKRAAGAGVARHPKRARFFRRMIEEGGPPRPWIGALLLDGAPIASMIHATHERRGWALEMAFDEAYAELAPGSLLLLLCVRRAIEERLATYNLMASYSYYKHRWLADVVPTCSAQLIKVGSRPYYRAILGDLRRAVQARLDAGAPPEAYNAEKRRVADVVVDDPRARAAAAARAAALATSGAVRTTSFAELSRALPFVLPR